MAYFSDKSELKPTNYACTFEHKCKATRKLTRNQAQKDDKKIIKAKTNGKSELNSILRLVNRIVVVVAVAHSINNDESISPFIATISSSSPPSSSSSSSDSSVLLLKQHAVHLHWKIIIMMEVFLFIAVVIVLIFSSSIVRLVCLCFEPLFRLDCFCRSFFHSCLGARICILLFPSVLNCEKIQKKHIYFIRRLLLFVSSNYILHNKPLYSVQTQFLLLLSVWFVHFERIAAISRYVRIFSTVFFSLSTVLICTCAPSLNISGAKLKKERESNEIIE